MPKLSEIFTNMAHGDRDPPPPTNVGSHWNTTAQHAIRIWHKASQIIPTGSEQDQQNLDTELEKRKIQSLEGTYILRWGYE